MEFDYMLYDMWDFVAKSQEKPVFCRERALKANKIFEPVFKFRHDNYDSCKALVRAIYFRENGIDFACKILEESKPEEAIRNLMKEFY